MFWISALLGCAATTNFDLRVETRDPSLREHSHASVQLAAFDGSTMTLTSPLADGSAAMWLGTTGVRPFELVPAIAWLHDGERAEDGPGPDDPSSGVVFVQGDRSPRGETSVLVVGVR